MTVSTATYKVGDTYTSQKSKVTGTIQEITPLANGNVRVKLDVAGSTRYTTTLRQKVLVDQVQHFEKRAVFRNVASLIGGKTASAFPVFLPPDFEMEVHL